ncbi:endonuclease/exonuclease/phosphatase family protein [Patescibacteria group bacterium]
MKLLNFNLNLRFPDRYWFKNPSLKKRLDVLKNKVSSLDPDIITFQEATDVLLLQQLRFMFKDYGFVCKSHLRIRGGVLTLFKKNTWCLTDKKFTAFTKQGKVFSKQLADRILKKGILVSLLENTQTRIRVLIINVHLTANYGQKLKDEERTILKIQLREIKDLIEKHKTDSNLQIIAGDFNANFQGKTIQNWLTSIKFTSAFKPEQCTVCPNKNPLCYRDQHKEYQIDNILCKNCKFLNTRLVFNKKGQFISDHFGQVASLEF